MYTVGMPIVYGRMGVCRIESIGAPPFQRDDGHRYYKLRAVYSISSEEAYVPVDTAETIRPLISGGEASASFGLVSQMRPQICGCKKMAELAAHYQEQLSSGQLTDCLLLMKEIYLKQKDLESHNKKLGQLDTRYLKIAEKLVCEELAAVLDSVPDLIRERLYAAMECEAAS